MPASAKEGKTEILSWVNNIDYDFKKVLDLGVGKGTYSRLFRKRHSKLSSAHWIGVEAWQPYIEQFDLRSQYHEIINKDIRLLDYSSLAPIDIAFAGDVLEHVSKEEAIMVVDRVLDICPLLIVSIPIIHYPQGALEGNPHEIHVKEDWTHREVLETFPRIRKHWTGNIVGCYLLSST